MSAPFGIIVVDGGSTPIIVVGGGIQGPAGPAGTGGSGTDPEFDSITLTGPGGKKYQQTVIGELPTGGPDIQWERIE